MSPSWIWSDKIINERVARVGYNHFISNRGEWNNCFSKFSNRVLPPIFISTILQSGKAHYFPYDVKLRLLAHSRNFLANQKARNAIVGAENLLKVFTRDLAFPCWDWATSDEQEKLPTGQGFVKIDHVKPRVGDGAKLERALLTQLVPVQRYDHVVESDLRKKKTFQKTLKFSDCRESIQKQIWPSCRKIFRLHFVFVGFRESNEI